MPMQPPTTATTPTAQPRRFDRAVEGTPAPADAAGPQVARDGLEAAIARSTLTEGGRSLARGLLRTARPAVFPGGGIGLDYASLLKTAARPDVVGPHVQEAARHLTDRGVDLLFVPGMSGYPIGAMYSLASGIPAVLLKKQRHGLDPSGPYPAGTFVIPSYTGEGDTVISADLAAVRDILADLVAGQLSLQEGTTRPRVTVRVAGADEIIDKATMAQAITETAPEVCHAVVRELLDGLPEAAGRSDVEIDVRVVAWVTPLLKGYNRPAERLAERTGIVPFAGLTITAIELDPPAIGIAGLGLVEVG
jgi:hypothetical protein